MSTNAVIAPSPLDGVRVRRIVEYVTRAHGVDVDTRALEAAVRRLPATSADPAEAVRQVASAAGLATAAVRRPLADVVSDADPTRPWLAIRAGSHGRIEGLAVLRRARGGAHVAVLADEPTATRWPTSALLQWFDIADAEAAVDWILAEPAAPLAALRSAEPGRPLTPIQRVHGMLLAERSTLGIAVVYSVVIALLSLIVPVAVQSVVNTIAFGSVLQPLVVLTLFVLVALGFSTVMNALRTGAVEIILRSIFARVATDVTWRLLRVRVEAFDRYHGPELVNRFFDTVTVQKSAALLLIDGLSIVMQTLIGMLLIALYHPWLLVFDILLVTAMLVIVFGLGRGAIETSVHESKAKYALEAWLEQLATHLITFKADGGARFALLKSQSLLEGYLSYRRKHFQILLRQVIGSFALQALASSALLGIGGWLVINRQLTLGQLVASELIVAGMLSAFTKFGKQLEVFYDLCAALDKLGALVDLPLERSGGDIELQGRGPMRVEAADLELTYPDGRRPALHVLALDVAPGERLGIAGSTGSGKSTLADVLFGLRVPTGGTLRLDGADVRSITLTDLRRQVALVRHVELFPGTVLDNVRLGRTELSHEDITRALDRVGLLDELLSLPNGLDTELHPHGRPLSHRQACRLMIARAIADAPRLLVLDGALDQVDLRSENDRLSTVLFSPEAPWTLLCMTEREDLLARCSRVLRLHESETRAAHHS
jgi:ABC-type bacteriocin/lantibiotic exporter with double-glycine peptidase domain